MGGGCERQRAMLVRRKCTPYAKPTSVKGQQTCDRYRMGLGAVALQRSGIKSRGKRGILSGRRWRRITPSAPKGDDMGSATGHRFDNIRPVLVPVEPARDAVEVAGAAAEVCAGLGAKAVLLDVKRSPDGMQREVRISGGTVAAVLEDGACAHLKALAGIFRAEGVPVDLAVREGDVAGNIVAEAADTIAADSEAADGEPAVRKEWAVGLSAHQAMQAYHASRSVTEWWMSRLSFDLLHAFGRLKRYQPLRSPRRP